MKELPGLIDEFLEYLEIFNSWVTASLPNKSLKDLTIADVRKYRVYLSNRVDKNGLTLKRITQNYYVIALRSFLRFIIKNDHETLEPSKIDLPKAESRSLKFLDRDQVDRLVISVDTQKPEGKRDRA